MYELHFRFDLRAQSQGIVFSCGCKSVALGSRIIDLAGLPGSVVAPASHINACPGLQAPLLLQRGTSLLPGPPGFVAAILVHFAALMPASVDDADEQGAAVDD